MARTLPHLPLPSPTPRPYTSPSGGGKDKPRKKRNRALHGAQLKQQLEQAWEKASTDQEVIQHNTRTGTYLQFKGEAGFEVATQSLENFRPKKSENQIRLLGIKESKDKETLATVFVPKDQKKVFLKKIQSYIDPENPKHAKLLDNIAEINYADKLEDFWYDLGNKIPDNNMEWCEVWLSTTNDKHISEFLDLLNKLDIHSKPHHLSFPERTVKLIYANKAQLLSLIKASDNIAEFRCATSTSCFWTEQSPHEQSEWVDNLLSRLTIPTEVKTTVCILDTGVTNGHRLLAPVLQDEHCLTLNDTWGVHDHKGHGTNMAGIAAYGCIQGALESDSPISTSHSLESVKIIPADNDNPKELWGEFTSRAISLAEVNDPEKNRIICMAVTAGATDEISCPSSWSAALDNITSGATDDFQRLFLISAGNAVSITKDLSYPDNILASSVQDPAQSWNALTIGAYTELGVVTEASLADKKIAAPIKSVSPFSTTSASWSNKWPVKPEVLFEGGNAFIDEEGNSDTCDDLSVLTTHHRPYVKSFDTFTATSLATAKAAYFAAKLQANHPDYWPETIRGLMVHSAEWTTEMKELFCKDESKASYEHMFKICGYGVPNLEKALYSANNSLTLISQEHITPYKKVSSDVKTNEFKLHELPWPKETLLALPPETELKMRITLSYFVEPGPGKRGWTNRYTYASHGLRFLLTGPQEDQENFEKRVSKAMREKEETPDSVSLSSYWTLGQSRNRGTIHSDVWTGTAPELAESNLIAIIPTSGWWRYRKHLGKAEKETRYSLIISIEAPEVDVDIYTPIANTVKIPIRIETTATNDTSNGQMSLF